MDTSEKEINFCTSFSLDMTLSLEKILFTLDIFNKHFTLEQF